MLETLTKNDILEMYAKRFSPHSPARSTFATQLVAQSSPADIAAKTTDSEKCEKLADQVLAMLAQGGLQVEPADRTKLVTELEKIDVTTGDVQSILNSIGIWLLAVGLNEESTKMVLAQGAQALPQLLPAAGIIPATEATKEPNDSNGHADTSGVPEINRVLVEDVKAWKAGLPLAPIPLPVKDISEFEELEPKL